MRGLRGHSPDFTCFMYSVLKFSWASPKPTDGFSLIMSWDRQNSMTIGIVSYLKRRAREQFDAIGGRFVHLRLFDDDFHVFDAQARKLLTQRFERCGSGGVVGQHFVDLAERVNHGPGELVAARFGKSRLAGDHHVDNLFGDLPRVEHPSGALAISQRLQHKRSPDHDGLHVHGADRILVLIAATAFVFDDAIAIGRDDARTRFSGSYHALESHDQRLSKQLP